MDFIGFLNKNKIKALFFPLVMIAVYIPIVFTKSYCADLEYVQGVKGHIYNWSELGRYTLLLIKKLCFTPYNTVLEGILFIFTSFLTVISLSYLLCLIYEKADTTVLFIFSCIALIFPTFSEQYYFKFQSFEVLFGIFLLNISGIFLVRFINEKKIRMFIVSVLANILSFGIYQSMLNIILVFYAGIFAFHAIKEEKDKLLRCAVSVIIQFALSFILNKLICIIFCEKGSYFSDKIMWKSYPFSTCYHFVKHYFRIVLLSESHMYTFTFLISIVLAFAAFVYLFIKTKAKALWVLPGIIGLIVIPFAIAIIQGFEPDSRTQLALPFSIAFLLLTAYGIFERYLPERKDEKKGSKSLTLIAVFISLFILLINIIPTFRLVYTRMKINSFDKENICKIGGDLNGFNCNENTSSSVPVIFIGTLTPEPDPLCYDYDEENKDYILISVFSLDADTEPEYFFSTNRILGAMDNEGFTYKKPNLSDYMDEAKEETLAMPSYPEEGYIKETENFVVVNLGNN